MGDVATATLPGGPVTEAAPVATGPITTVSIVVPVYSGAEYLPRLVEEVARLRASWQAVDAPISLAELILVDDSARDASPALIDALGREHDWIVPLHLSRNYGQHGATVAGILYSTGDWIVTMDEDLQHPPMRVPDLLQQAVLAGADIAYARPTGAVHRARARDWSSVAVKRMMQWVTGTATLRHVNSFRLVRGAIARSGASVAMHDTYLDINFTWFTNRIIAVPMNLVDERYVRTGRSGYRLRTLIGHGWRMLFSSHLQVLQVTTVAGAAAVAASVAFGVGLVLVKLLVPSWITVEGWTSIALLLSFFGGSLMAMVGVALQYLSTLVLRGHGKPTFFVVDRAADARLLGFFAGGR